MGSDKPCTHFLHLGSSAVKHFVKETKFLRVPKRLSFHMPILFPSGRSFSGNHDSIYICRAGGNFSMYDIIVILELVNI